MEDKDEDISNEIRQVVLKDESFTDKDIVWNKIVHRIEELDNIKHSHTVSRRLKIRWYWHAAASVAAVICLVIAFGSRINITNSSNELQYVLPDGSTVNLAENSSIRYNRIGWWFAHRVTLDGNASFEVTKQNADFSVIANAGTITVLGTKFIIEQQANNLHVSCTEGSVAVKTEMDTAVLHQDEQLNYDGLQMQVSPIYPEYLEFNNSPLSDVMKQIESIYGIMVQFDADCGSRLFSGWVPTQNLGEALELIMGSCGLNYALNGDNLTVRL